MIPQSERTFKRPRWIVSSRDLPPERKRTRVDIDGQATTLSGRKLQILQALKIGPINCASTVRLSDAVLRLKVDDNIRIATERPTDAPAFYSLQSKVEVLS